jgi:hypothetical protein
MFRTWEHSTIPKKNPTHFYPTISSHDYLTIIIRLSHSHHYPTTIPLKKKNIIWTAMFDTSRQVPTRFRSLLPPGIAARKHRENCGYVKEMSLETGDKNGWFTTLNSLNHLSTINYDTHIHIYICYINILRKKCVKSDVHIQCVYI